MALSHGVVTLYDMASAVRVPPSSRPRSLYKELCQAETPNPELEEMLLQLGDLPQDDQKNAAFEMTASARFRAAVRRGVPCSLRKSFLKLAARAFDDENTVNYEQLKQPNGAPWEDDISKDLDRTFPSWPEFVRPSGRDSLGNVLRAVGSTFPDVGYCQSMNFVAALYLAALNMDLDAEEYSFRVLRKLMRTVAQSYYVPSLEGFTRDLLALQGAAERVLPRTYSDLKSRGADLAIIAPGWLLTLFSSVFPPKVALRLIDCALIEGPAVLLRTVLACLHFCVPRANGLLGIFEENEVFEDSESGQDEKCAVPDGATSSDNAEDRVQIGVEEKPQGSGVVSCRDEGEAVVVDTDELARDVSTLANMSDSKSPSGVTSVSEEGLSGKLLDQDTSQDSSRSAQRKGKLKRRKLGEGLADADFFSVLQRLVSSEAVAATILDRSLWEWPLVLSNCEVTSLQECGGVPPKSLSSSSRELVTRWADALSVCRRIEAGLRGPAWTSSSLVRVPAFAVLQDAANKACQRCCDAVSAAASEVDDPKVCLETSQELEILRVAYVEKEGSHGRNSKAAWQSEMTHVEADAAEETCVLEAMRSQVARALKKAPGIPQYHAITHARAALSHLFEQFVPAIEACSSRSVAKTLLQSWRVRLPPPGSAASASSTSALSSMFSGMKSISSVGDAVGWGSKMIGRVVEEVSTRMTGSTEATKGDMSLHLALRSKLIVEKLFSEDMQANLLQRLEYPVGSYILTGLGALKQAADARVTTVLRKQFGVEKVSQGDELVSQSLASWSSYPGTNLLCVDQNTRVQTEPVQSLSSRIRPAMSNEIYCLLHANLQIVASLCVSVVGRLPPPSPPQQLTPDRWKKRMPGINAQLAADADTLEEVLLCVVEGLRDVLLWVGDVDASRSFAASASTEIDALLTAAESNSANSGLHQDVLDRLRDIESDASSVLLGKEYDSIQRHLTEAMQRIRSLKGDNRRASVLL